MDKEPTRMRSSLASIVLVAFLAALFVTACTHPGPVGSRPGTAAGPGGALGAPPPPGTEELWIIERYEEDDLGQLSYKRKLEQSSTIGADRLRNQESGGGEQYPTNPNVPLQGPQAGSKRSLMDVAGCGGLVTDDPASNGTVPVPLEHTNVLARVAGSVASVAVRQEFSNPFDTKIEAVYVFPLPHDAAVHEFVMTIGERTIRGILRERAEAEQLYAHARAAGRIASLLTQERPNVFTQKVANIEPGKAIDIEIEYFHALPYVDGWYELVFPMVVGPRFNPQGTSQQATEVTYMTPRERSGHDIALAVELDAGTRIEELACDTHEVSTLYEDARFPGDEATHAHVELVPHDRVPNRDFVLRWRVAGGRLKTSWLAHGDAQSGTFALALHPPASPDDLPRQPIEMICVVDTSGSMKGQPLDITKSALQRLLDRLGPDDAFQIVRFSSSSTSLGSAPLAGTPNNIRRGRRYIDDLSARGGTQMIKGIRAALRCERDPERQTVIAFLTDGFIGNEEEILSEVRREIDDARIFSFGIGASPNRFLLEALAREGRGTVAYVGLNPRGGEVMASAFDRMCRPALTGVQLDFGGLEVSGVFPHHVPDLFAGRSVIVTGRYVNRTGDDRLAVRVSGEVAGQHTTFDMPCDLGSETDHAGIERLWARTRIADLVSEARAARDEFERQAYYDRIRETALEHGLMSAFTAFVAVDSLTQSEGEFGTTVPVPVPVPAGVQYETAVGG
jgi:Ca-activated chloride channel family protein